MKRALLCILTLVAVSLPANATWSIVVVDHATGEVGVASATCLANFTLENFVPVLVVGKGAGAAQATLDNDAGNRQIAFGLLMQDATPDQILDALLTLGSQPQMRQYGIAAFSGSAATFTGSGAGDAIGNLVGSVGTMTYAIQGNVLVGSEPVFAAEEALVSTPGDLSQRMMAAMQAARALGGDGRCSCSGSDPTGCGVPPPGFTKSAHCGFVYLARMGDTDGVCDSVNGCANGSYYLQIAYSGSVSDPDPVLELQTEYDAWRAGLAGRPDGILSTATSSAQRLPADGLTGATVTVRLVDVEGQPLTTGGASVTVAPAPGSAVTDLGIGPVSDLGDGSYTFDVVAGSQTGTATLAIVADDGTARATLYPYPSLDLDPPAELFVGFDTLDAASGASVPITLDVPSAAGGAYLVLASASGTSPGVMVGNVLLPLNPDPVLLLTFQAANTGGLTSTFGTLDPSGRATATFAAPPGLLLPAVGLHVDWAALHAANGVLGATNADGFDVVLGS